MKLKTYTINNQGEVCEVPAFSRGLSMPEVQAPTKTEAGAKLLLAAKRMAEHTPELYIQNDAFLLVFHNGEMLCAQTGPIREQHETGRQFSCCSSGGFKNTKEALKKSSFRYYGSEEYRAASAA